MVVFAGVGLRSSPPPPPSSGAEFAEALKKTFGLNRLAPMKNLDWPKARKKNFNEGRGPTGGAWVVWDPLHPRPPSGAGLLKGAPGGGGGAVVPGVRTSLSFQ